MTDRPFSRRVLLIGAALTIAGLAGCARDASSFLTGTPSSLAGGSPLLRVTPQVSVSKPTGEAIQKAINSLGSTGGTVYLTAKLPYVVDRPIQIPYNNIKLIGKGAGATQLVAKPGAVLTLPGYNEEYLLVVLGASGVTIEGLLLDAINQANSSGNPRVGVGVWNSSVVHLFHVAVQNNLGPNAVNKAVAVYKSTSFVFGGGQVFKSRTGIYLSQTSKFAINQTSITGCSSQPPIYSGPNAGIFVDVSSTGTLRSNLIQRNKIDAAVMIKDSHQIVVESNKIQKTFAFPTGSGNNGVAITGGGSLRVDSNQFLGNSGAAVAVSGASKVSVDQNQIRDNGNVGQVASIQIAGDTDTVVVASNSISRIKRGTYPGIDAGSATGLDVNGQILNNQVHGFGVGVALGTKSKSYLVENNDLRLNATCVTNNGTGNTINGNLC